MTPAEVRLLHTAAREFGVTVGSGALDRVARFLDVLALWNRRIHLTGERRLPNLIRNHVIDSLAPARHLPRSGLLIDVGSGAGFPGIVLACLHPDLEVALMEARRRRASFLREAIRAVPLPAARVLEMRAEEAATDPELAGRAAVAISRAIRLEVFLAVAAPLLAAHGTAIAMQTPRTAALARERALSCGLRVATRWDYALPGGAARTLLLFKRASPVP